VFCCVFLWGDIDSSDFAFAHQQDQVNNQCSIPNHIQTTHSRESVTPITNKSRHNRQSSHHPLDFFAGLTNAAASLGRPWTRRSTASPTFSVSPCSVDAPVAWPRSTGALAPFGCATMPCATCTRSPFLKTGATNPRCNASSAGRQLGIAA